ncbi:MAG: ABC transporter permease [Clostridia bacterium]|nr:ABC transporter permease [Clostridia bacterium]
MLNLLKKDIKLMINIKKTIVIMIGFLLIFTIFSSMFQDYMQEKRLIDKLNVGIVDNEDSLLSGMLIGHFQNNKEFMSLFTIEVSDETSLLNKFNNNELSAIIHIPVGFTDSLLHFENTPLKIILNSNYPLQNTVLENIMMSYSTYIKAVDVGIYSLYQTLKSEGVDQRELNDINDSFSANMVLTALRRNYLFQHEVIETFPSTTSSQYFVFAIMLLLIIFTATSGASLLSDEIKNNVLIRYKMTGNHFIKFTASKIIVMYLNMVTLLLPLSIVIKWMNDELILSSFLLLMLFISLIIVFFSLLALTLGIILIKFDINLLMATMITMVLGILGGNFIPIQIMPKFIQDISSLTPNYWMLRTCLLLNNNHISNEVKITSFVILVTSFIILFIHSYFLRKGHLWEK